MAALIQFASGAPGIKYSLHKRHITIGRGTSGNDICLPCSFVSKQHARIEIVDSLLEADGYDVYLEDLQSTNHTYVNDQPIERVRLEDGDVVRIGRNTFKYDASEVEPRLEPLHVDLELPSSSQSQTWNFSRRLRLMDNA